MRNLSCKRIPWLAALACAAALLLSACGGRGVNKDLLNQASNIPPSFDVTLIADKDNQFDYDGAPLTEEDLRSALRYRKDQNLPVATIIVKRGEKERIKNEHIIALARVSYQLKIRAFMQAKDGTISELRAQLKEDENAPKPEAGK
ncbi:MAG TPA: hypothetical protein VGO25_10185 [Rhodanobacteraceae bacterium]|jgi:hypothetical protein|nr:hypothetical protein [Rhodanobacteraceae bacterium]